MEETRLLIVEDERIVALDLELRLRRLEYTVIAVAGSGEEALELAEETPPDLVLMDIKLRGDLDGLETARALRERLDVPVVYLTAYADDRTLARAKATEAFGYLLKPFGERELQVAIEMALYKHSLERKLRSYAADLEARNRELDAYAHTVAHDLKHPLTMILGFTNMLAGGLTAMSDEELDLCTRRIAASVQKMANVIDELLLLSEVRTGNAEMSRVDMARVVDAAQKRLAALIERRQAQISGPRSWPSALGYAPWVEEVWVNYLSNAIKYGGDPPQVELGTDVDQKAGPSNGTVQFWVRDNGPGLTEEEQSRLFTPFTRLDQVRAQGHGLGLSIVQRIVERLGGEVGVESQVGEGSTFYFKLKTC